MHWIKNALKGIIFFIVSVASVVLAFIVFSLIDDNAWFTFIWRESQADTKLFFVGIVLFCGLYFLNTISQLAYGVKHEQKKTDRSDTDN